MFRSLILYLAVVAGILLFSGVFVVIFGNSIEVHCLREAGREPSCQITRRLLGRVPVSSRDVLGVIDAHMDETCDDGCSYRAMLITSSGQRVPVDDVYTDRAIVARQLEALEGFLGSSAATLTYVAPVQWWVLWMIGAMDVIGLAAVAGNFLRSARRGR